MPLINQNIYIEGNSEFLNDLLIVISEFTEDRENSSNFINYHGYDIIVEFLANSDDNIISNSIDILSNIINTSEGLLAILVDYNNIVQKLIRIIKTKKGDLEQKTSELYEKIKKDKV